MKRQRLGGRRVHGTRNSTSWRSFSTPTPETVSRHSDCGIMNVLILVLLVVLAWNYRRYVLASMPVRRHDTSELAYTSKKIQANFSNFSAWHQRSKVLPKLWASGALDETKSREEGMPPALSRLRSGP